ncbi:HAD-IIIC family phosphatase [Acetobacter musti]|uniref:HAD-IIIC family phosphatase n=1 Tax=Acetobacter musti TaxID=864732 RepID=A0ABX0JRU7_9PROT|nr:HAD-IIIC family phosphatase [Acetobacter musti]NHN85270.1 HAD-IIIC family phosphatase [Acetobacter musti]
MLQMDWLPACPAGFDSLDTVLQQMRGRCDGPQGLKLLRAAAGCRRNFIQTSKADRFFQKITEGEAGIADDVLRPVRIAILAAHSVEHLLPATRVAALARGMNASLYVAPYGQYRQVIHNRDPDLAAFAPQFVLFAPDMRDSPLSLPLTATYDEVTAAVTRRVEELHALWRAAAEFTGAAVIQQTFLNMDLPVFGSFERLVPASDLSVFLRLQMAVAEAAREEGVLLLDMDQCAALAGGARKLHDSSRWYQARQLISPEVSVIWGDMLARVVAAALGLSRKCLIVDLDNTLWGGVAGDDGPENLRLGAGSPDGEAFFIFQEYIGRLLQRGIALAICSKNDPDVAEAAFSLSTMALRRQDVAAFVANWNNKADNIRQIAETLRLGLDAMVFADDNPAERDIVRRELPQVAVPELMDDPADYPRILSASGWFEAAAFTADDAVRVRNYSHEVSRMQARENATDLEAYLSDLRMVLTGRRMTEADAPRVLQLLNKTNQFNLTSRRYTGPEFQALADRPDTRIWTFRLADRFGDHGLISVVILTGEEREDGDPAERGRGLAVHDWIMSCRVLGRGVEDAVLSVVAEAADRENAPCLKGEYCPTSRNGMVSGLYRVMGFSEVEKTAGDDATFWVRSRDAPLSDRCRTACSLIRITTRHD